MTRVDLDRVWMQRSEANLPFVMRFVMTGRAPVSFLAREDSLPLQQNGVEITPADIILYGDGTNPISTTGLSHLQPSR